jgi:hypothetical protein
MHKIVTKIVLTDNAEGHSYDLHPKLVLFPALFII